MEVALVLVAEEIETGLGDAYEFCRAEKRPQFLCVWLGGEINMTLGFVWQLVSHANGMLARTMVASARCGLTHN